MPVVTRLAEQKRSPSRRSVYLDGVFAFGLNVNVVARFRLREGMTLTPEQVEQIRQGEVRQECMDKALRLLGSRLHSRAELQRKLTRGRAEPAFAADVVEGVLNELTRLEYVDDERFARTRALAAAQHKHHGRRRAMLELRKAGVKHDAARRALDDVYSAADSTAVARELARKRAPQLRKLDPLVARRRLAGMLQRRGFEYDAIKPVIDEVLGENCE